MTIGEFLFLLGTSSIATIILAAWLKRLLNKIEQPYRANAVALDSAMVSCTGISMLYRVANGFDLGYSHVLLYRLVAVILVTWLVSMYIYDKGKQFIEQHKRFRKTKQQK